MSDEAIRVTTSVEAPAETVFAVLADPSTHAAIDGTGWVQQPREDRPLAAAGQVFRMRMYHPDHPDGYYEVANRVEVFDPPRAVSWLPGQDADEPSELRFGGWVWRYDLAATSPSATEVTLTYDWSAVPASVREYITFPPFALGHLENSLAHLAELALGHTST